MTAWRGWALLAALLVPVAIWVGWQGPKYLRTAQTLPSLPSQGLQRFRADMGYLPDEALLGFVEIPAGTFTMGSDYAVDRMAYIDERWSESSRQGSVQLRTFYIARYEVTVAQYWRFAQASQRRMAPELLRRGADTPVSQVSWPEALAYAEWLQAEMLSAAGTPQTLRAMLRDGWHVALPTEAQWEKAARGADARIYPWGNQPNPQFANYRGIGILPVGSKPCACVYELADMIGNVWEMTRSPFQPYPFNAAALLDPHSAPLFVMRGGSYQEADNNARAAVRGRIDPGARSEAVGFRLVLTRD
jgi:formylglycine-generating enzyme required for sulfatase activity